MKNPFPKHLLGTEGLPVSAITAILDRAEEYTQKKAVKPVLAGRTVINLFFENSTRTRTSFEMAAQHLGANVVNMDVATSSVKKGESLVDTALTLNAMKPDVIVMRHADSGAVQLITNYVDCAVINAGDGAHEHPTQALLDALTIRQRKGRLQGLTVAICGDILHSRVGRSNIHLLNAMGATVRVIGPPTLIPSGVDRLGAEVYHDFDKGMKDADVVMMLRLQAERMQGQYVPSMAEYYHLYGLTHDRLKHAKPDVMVMHPGPMNRGVEIDSAVADDSKRSVITTQVNLGVAVRMACLSLLMEARA